MATKVAVFFFFSIFLPLLINSSANGGFSVGLIHRDSPLSPFYDPSAAASDRANQAAQRSLSRLHYLRSSASDASLDEIQSPLSAGSGDFLIKLAVGSPPVEFLAVMDTGSDLIWTQCLPCTNCYPQNNPLFDPKKSISFTISPCTSSLCQALGEMATCSNGCQYSYSYGDQSYTNGVLATEMFTFSTTNGSTMNIKNVYFGCGRDNDGNYESKAAGLVGLGAGPLSLISQLGSLMSPRFSYCLMQFSDVGSISIMNFGEDAIISGDGVVSTPITSLASSRTFYFLTLYDITVGAQKLSIPAGTFDITPSGEGGLIIDSGTTLTFLNPVAYELVESAVKSFVKLPSVSDPRGRYKVCYNATGEDSESFPSMIFHFSGGDVHLSPLNTLRQLGGGVKCLAVLPGDNSGRSVYGNIAQQNFRVGYDLRAKTVSFQQFDCTKM